jgi:hypothetical protein
MNTQILQEVISVSELYKITWEFKPLVKELGKKTK